MISNILRNNLHTGDDINDEMPSVVIRATSDTTMAIIKVGCKRFRKLVIHIQVRYFHCVHEEFNNR
jgi:hypothetical protein